MRQVLSIGAVIAAIPVAGPLLAQDSTKAVGVPSVSDGLWPAMLKLALAVVVIIGLIYVSMILLRKLSLQRSGVFGSRGSLELLERSYFSPKKFVCLMRVGKKMLLVGVSENGINLVADVSDQEFPAHAPDAKKGSGASFKNYFQQAKAHLSSIASKM
jgi:flagellar biogenesis protein FliO